MSRILDLPEDIIFDIFYRLPVKSLVLCRHVSKPWRALITSPHFIKFHIEKSMKTGPKIVLNSENSSKFSIIDMDTMAPKTLTVDHKCSETHEYSIVGSCNGLLCLSEFGTYISLWNPLLHEYFTLPNDPIDHRIPIDKATTVVGFGYNLVKDQYKVVKFVHFFSCEKSFHLSEVKVCTLGKYNKASWRSVNIEQPYVFQNPNDAVVHLNGVLYWLNTNRRRSKDEETKVICFDTDSEEFHTLSCPEGEFGTHELNLGMLQGYLSLSHRSKFESLDIWLMKDSGWTQLFTINLPRSMLQSRGFTVNYCDLFEPMVLQRNGELVVKCGKKDLIVYDPSKGTYRYPIIRGINDWSTSFTYVEALTSLTTITGHPCNEQRRENKAWAFFSYLFNLRSRCGSHGGGNGLLISIACM